VLGQLVGEVRKDLIGRIGGDLINPSIRVDLPLHGLDSSSILFHDHDAACRPSAQLWG